jgi:hypothetical protein
MIFRDFIPRDSRRCYSRRHANEGIMNNKIQIIKGEKSVPGTVSTANRYLADAVIATIYDVKIVWRVQK